MARPASPSVPFVHPPARPGIPLLCLLALGGCGAGSAASPPVVAPAAPRAITDDTPALQAEAEALFRQRGDAQALQGAIQAWTRRLDEAPGDPAAALGLSRALRFQARQLQATDPAGALESLHLAHLTAEALVARLHPRAPSTPEGTLDRWLATLPDAAVEALYLSSVSRFDWGQLSGFAQRAMDAPRLRACLLACLRRRPDLDHGGPDRALGTLFAHPVDPALRDIPRSKAHFEAALQRGPDYLGNHLAFARHYAVAAQDRETFEAMLQHVLSATIEVGADAAPDQSLAQAAARALFDLASELFE